jgi:hypothetical protein
VLARRFATDNDSDSLPGPLRDNQVITTNPPEPLLDEWSDPLPDNEEFKPEI